MKLFYTFIFLLLFVLLACGQNSNTAPSHRDTEIFPPLYQPESGPGGSNYEFGKILVKEFGNGPDGGEIFYPRGATIPLPLVVFLHGYSAISPGFYYYWILHLVKKGSVVVYPYYQGNFSVGVNKMYSNAVTGVKNAMKILYAEGISVENGIGLIGHSLGGVFAAALAVDWRIFNLPFPRFVFSVEPGAGFAIFYKDYSIPASTLLVTLAGDMDLVVGSATADEIFSQGGAQRKCEIFLRSESRGDFSLVADHFAPLASEKFINAFDWYGFWKWSVALMDCAYYNKYCDYVLEDLANARFMGKWSDGKSVKEPIFDCRK